MVKVIDEPYNEKETLEIIKNVFKAKYLVTCSQSKFGVNKV